MLSATTQLALVAGNVLTLLGGGALLIRWLRNWLIKQVAQPVNDLSDVVHEQGKKLEDVDTRTRDAHKRIDDLMLGRATTNA
jgi:hypothetical protein